MKTHYRMFTPADIDSLVSFWNENGGWDFVNREVWEHRFYHTPQGPTSIVLAVDPVQDTILGQFIFIPYLLSLNGQKIKALRPFAFIINKEFRSGLGYLAIFEQINKMYQYGIKVLAEKGAQLIYMLPDPRWARAFKLVPSFQLENFPLWSLKLYSDYFSSLSDEYSVITISADDCRLDDLWKKARRFYGCSLVRNAASLNWKLSHKKYDTIGLVKANELVGFSASFYRKEDKQWLICDMLVKHEEAMKLMIRANYFKAIQFKNTLSPEEQCRLEKVAILATPLIQRIIKEMGFLKDNYTFPMVVHVLDPKLNKKEIKPETWYVGAHD